MKKLLLIAFLTIILVGCSENSLDEQTYCWELTIKTELYYYNIQKPVTSYEKLRLCDLTESDADSIRQSYETEYREEFYYSIITCEKRKL